MIAVTVELSDDEMALLLRLAAGNGTTASELATRLFRAELNRRMHLLGASPTALTAAEPTVEIAATPTPVILPDADPFAYLDTPLFSLHLDALKVRFEREMSDFDIWWNGLPALVCEGVRDSMQNSSADVRAGQLSSASGLYIRMRE